MWKTMLLIVALVLPSLTLSAEEPAPPAKPWASSFGAGLATTRGNTDTKNINLSFSTKYDPKTKFLFKADAIYLRGDSDGVKQVDKAAANVREEYTLSERAFTFGEVSYLRDPFKDLDYFVAPLVGAGYRVIKSDVQNLAVDAAVGAQAESDSTGRSTSGAVKAGENYDWAFSKTSKLTQKLTGIWKTQDMADALYHFDIGVTASMATRLDLKVAYLLDYKSRVPSPAIKKGDSAFVAAIVVKF